MIQKDVRGKTLEVYYFLTSHPDTEFGVREIQRELNYSSPSVASYHLSRLYNFHLVEKNENGRYFVKKKDPLVLGELADHIRVAEWSIPTLVVYVFFGVFAILIAIAFFVVKMPNESWFVFVLFYNLIFIFWVIRDVMRYYKKIEQ